MIYGRRGANERTPMSQIGTPGEMRFAAPKQDLTWFHGTTDANADSIVRSQKLHGSGDFGEGGYLASSKDVALDHTGTSPDDYQYDPSPSTYPGLVEAKLQPKRPWYGGGEGPRIDPDPNAPRRGFLRDRDELVEKLKRQGNDVWFPLKGARPSDPKSYAVLLDDNAGRSAQFSKGKIDPYLSEEYTNPEDRREGDFWD